MGEELRSLEEDADKNLFMRLPVSFGVMRAGTCSHPGTSLLQEDSCLSSGSKCMMKGTASPVGTAACMQHFYKSGSEKLCGW